MSEEKRKLGDYEIIQSIYIGDKEVVFGVDKKDPYPFMVCCCDYHNPLSAAWPTEGIASDDYQMCIRDSLIPPRCNHINRGDMSCTAKAALPEDDYLAAAFDI